MPNRIRCWPLLSTVLLIATLSCSHAPWPPELDRGGGGPGPGPGCSNTIECACIEGNEAACQQLAEVNPERAKEIERLKPQKPTSPNQMQKEVERGSAPREVERVDRAHPPEDPQDHAHVKTAEGEVRVRQDGTTKPEDAALPRQVIEWLRKHGWNY